MNFNEVYTLQKSLKNNEVLRLELVNNKIIMISDEDTLNRDNYNCNILHVVKKLSTGVQTILIDLDYIVVACNTRKVKV